MSNCNSRGFFRLVFHIYDNSLVGWKPDEDIATRKIHDFIESHCITNNIYMRSDKRERLVRKDFYPLHFYICATDSEVIDFIQAYMDDFPYSQDQVKLVEIFKGEEYNSNYLLWWTPSVGFMQGFWDEFRNIFSSREVEKAHKLICKLLEP